VGTTGKEKCHTHEGLRRKLRRKEEEEEKEKLKLDNL
jgi:hypothetical protein